MLERLVPQLDVERCMNRLTSRSAGAVLRPHSSCQAGRRRSGASSPWPVGHMFLSGVERSLDSLCATTPIKC